jgi:hypothetical protein
VNLLISDEQKAYAVKLVNEIVEKKKTDGSVNTYWGDNQFNIELEGRLAEVVLADFFKVERPSIENMYEAWDLLVNGKKIDLKYISFRGEDAYLKDKQGREIGSDFYLAVREDTEGFLTILGFIEHELFERDKKVENFGYKDTWVYPVRDLRPFGCLVKILNLEGSK